MLPEKLAVRAAMENGAINRKELWMRRTSFLMFLVLASSCAVGPPELADIGQSLDGMPTGGGTNSPTIDDHTFHELNLAGLENFEHFKILGFTGADNRSYSLKVSNGRLSGVSGALTIQGPGLVGATIDVSYLPTNSMYGIKILEVGSAQTWATLAGTHGSMPGSGSNKPRDLAACAPRILHPISARRARPRGC